MNSWFLLHHGECLGPYTLKEVKLLFTASYMVRKADEENWLPAGMHPELMNYFIPHSSGAVGSPRTTRLQQVKSWLEETVFPQVQWFKENREKKRTMRRHRALHSPLQNNMLQLSSRSSKDLLPVCIR